MNDRAKEAFDFFISKGWTPAQAAGIVGHGLAESGMNPSRNQDGGNAFGTFQWDDRKPKMLAWVRASGRADNDFRAQLEYAQHELETSESYAATQLRAAKTVEQATAAFMHFERPQGYTRDNPTAGHNWSGRLSFAKAVFNGSASYPMADTGASTNGLRTSTSTDKVSWDNPIAPRQVWSDTETNQMRAQTEAQANPYGLWEGFKAARQDESMLTWIAKGQTDLLPDPNWAPSMDLLKAAQQGIPQQFHKQFGQAHSQAHLELIREGILKDMDYEKRMADLGWTGTALKLGASLTTPENLALLLVAPEVGIPAKASMWARVGIKAGEAAALNTAMEVPRVMEKPSAHGSDLLWAAGTGAVLGGAFGAFARNPALKDEAAQLERIGKSLQSHAEEELRAGTALRSPGFLDATGNSVGAAKNSPREALTATADDWMHGAVDDAIARAWAPGVRWDVAAKGKASDNAATRAFTDNAVVDVVGNADKSKVSHIAAEEWQKQLDFDFTFRAEKAHVEGLNEFMQNNGYKAAQKFEAEQEFKRQVTDYIDNVRPEKEFDAAVKKVGEMQRKLYADYLDYAQQPGLLDGSTRRSVKGFENVEKNPNYRPNVADHEKIDALSIRYGDDTMREAIARAFIAKVPELGEELAAKMAKGYWRTLREAVAGMSNLDRALHGTDMEALTRALSDLNLGEKEVAHIIQTVAPKPTEGGVIARAKRRALYDNNFEVRVKAKDGQWETFRMKDLFQDDYLYNFKNYSRQMSGQISMAMMRVKNPLFHALDNPTVPEHLIDGITSRSDFDQFIRDMRAVWDAKTEMPQATRKAMADRDEARLRFMYDRITGVPDQTNFPNLAKWARAIHGYNYTRVMNQVGLAQLGEMLGVTTQLGLKAAMQGIPTFKAMLRDAKTGELKSSFAREMEELSGFGADFFRDGFRHHKDDLGGFIDRGLNGKVWNKVEDVMHTGKRITNTVSGMAAVDGFSRRWASAAVVMKIINAAAKTGEGEVVKGLNMGRMAALGVDEAMAKRIFSQIRKHADFEGGEVSGRKYLQGNFGKWDDQEAFSHFRNAVWRWSRMVIQEGHVGQGNVLLSHPMARTIIQFRNFMMGAWTNQLLRNLHHMDFSTFANFMMTSVVGGMVYTGQQYLNSMGRSDQKDYLKDKLSPSGIAKAMVQRGEWSSIMPTIFDTGAFMVGAKPWFEDRASGTASNIFGNPTMDLVTSGQKALHGMARAAREGGWSQGEIRSLQRILPFQNVIGVQPLVNSLIAHQPERAPGATR